MQHLFKSIQILIGGNSSKQNSIQFDSILASRQSDSIEFDSIWKLIAKSTSIRLLHIPVKRVSMQHVQDGVMHIVPPVPPARVFKGSSKDAFQSLAGMCNNRIESDFAINFQIESNLIESDCLLARIESNRIESNFASSYPHL